MLEPEVGASDGANSKKPEPGRGCWHHMSHTKRCLVYAIVLLVVLIIMLAIYIGVSASKRKPQEIENLCVTRDCIESADLIRTSMDTSFDPCTDFYEYSCGRYVKQNQYSEMDYGFVLAITSLMEATKKAVINILEKPIVDEDKVAGRELKIAYASCMDELMNKDPPWSKIKTELNKIGLRDWPQVLENWDDNKFSVEEALIYLIMMKVPIFFQLERYADVDRNVYTFKLDAIASQFALHPTFAGDYRMFMVDVFEAMQVPDAPNVADSVITFQGLIETSYPTEQLSELKTPTELDEAYPGWNFKEIYGKIFEAMSIEEKEIDELVFNVSIANTLKFVPGLIKQVPKRTVMSYMVWQFIFHVSRYASADLRWKYRVLMMKAEEELKVYPPWRQCLDHLSPHFSEALTLLYANNMFSQEMLYEIRSYLDGIKRSFKRTVPKQTWINEEIEQQVYAKLDNLSVELSYPPEMMQSKDLDEKYSVYEMMPNNFIANMLKLSIFESQVDISAVGTGERTPEWLFNPLTINAGNYLVENYIVVPIGILYPPFFQLHRPRYLNYGTCGYLIAHEVGHTFDSLGIISYNQTKWSPENAQLHRQQAQCFIDQYDKYFFDGGGVLPLPHQVNGERTIDDNIADHVGLTHAYGAYKEFQESHAPEPLLPGLNYTQTQLFFIQFAQTWCTSYSIGGAFKALSDEHAPNKWRINGPLANSPAFADAFKCPKGSPLNPEKKCTMWA